MGLERFGGRPGWFRLPSLDGILAVSVPVGLFALLAAFMTHDPATGVTASNSPFSDEGWNLLNARNFAVLGHWSTDEWNRQLISVPYSLIHTAVFIVAGSGIVQARIVEIVATAVTAGLIVLGVRRAAGIWPAVFAGTAYGTAALVLYYGRLALLEPLVALGLTLGAVLLATAGDRRPVLTGVLAGLGLTLAIGTKALAIPSAGGLLAAALLVGWRSAPTRRRWVSALLTLALAAAAWLIFVWLPNRAEIAASLATLPAESAPADPHQALSRVLKYALGSDGVLTLGAPLLVGGGVGAAIGLWRWHRLEPATRDLLVVAIGWFVAGFGMMALVPYAPSRYVVPALPPLALMIGIGVQALSGWRPRQSWLPAVTAGVALVALSGPGIVLYSGWMASSQSTIPSVQAQVAEAVPPGATVAGGYAPLFGMRTSGATIFSDLGINQGDLYAAGIRWVIVQEGEVPTWASDHSAAWAARRLVLATTWGGRRVELYQLP